MTRIGNNFAQALQTGPLFKNQAVNDFLFLAGRVTEVVGYVFAALAAISFASTYVSLLPAVGVLGAFEGSLATILPAALRSIGCVLGGKLLQNI